MATPVFYQTMNNVGVDPTVYYTWTASTTPETPAPPFLVGTQAIGSDGSQFVFVQASTSISLTDFVMLASPFGAPYQANSLTTTNVQVSWGIGLGSTGLVVKQSVTFIPAGAYFWALTRGQYVPATTSGGTNGLAANNPPVVLFTSATAGIVTSITALASISAALVGIVCVSSITLSTGTGTSITPPAGTLSATGLTLGPVVHMNNPRTIIWLVTAFAGGQSLTIGSF